MENQTNGLDELLKAEPVKEEVSFTDQEQDALWVRVIETLVSLETSLGNLHVANRTLAARVGTLENFVSYLISKDPKAGPKFKELAEKAEKAAQSAVVEEPGLDETQQVLSALPPQAE